MAVRSINRRSGTAGLRSVTANAIDFVCDSADSDKIKFKDSGGVVRTLIHGPFAPVTISGDGAITIQPSLVKLTKGSAAAITLAAPTAAQEGTRITVVSDSAFAHVITATGLINDGVTGGAKTTATFAAFAGASIELVAINLKWAVVSKNVVTIA